MKKIVFIATLATFCLINLISQTPPASSAISGTLDWEIKSGFQYSYPSRILLDGDNAVGGSVLIESNTGMNGTGNITLNSNQGKINLTTAYGNIEIGAQNTSWAHIYSDRPNFIFNKPVYATNSFLSYNSHLNLEAASGYYVNIQPRSSSYGLILREYNSTDYGNFEITSTGLGIGYNTGEAHMTINSSGNLGIGTTTFDSQNRYKMEVNGTAKFYAGVQVKGNNTGGTMISAVNNSPDIPADQSLFWGCFGWDVSQANNPGLLALTDETNYRFIVRNNGQVGINCDPGNSSYMLTVKGNILCSKVTVMEVSNIPDYVFEKEYELMSLEEIEKYINENKHLPSVPSAKEVKENGLDLVEMNVALLKKVEEITLLLIEQNKTIQTLKAQMAELNK